jgi:hypothetical protein
MSTPGGIVEWVASDGRKGKLTGPGKTRSHRSRSRKASSEKGAKTAGCSEKKDSQKENKTNGKDGKNDANNNVANDKDDPPGWSAEEDQKLLDWKAEHKNGPWLKCADEIGKPQFQCKERWKQIQPKSNDQNAGKAQGGGDANGATKKENKANKKQNQRRDQNQGQNKKQEASSGDTGNLRDNNNHKEDGKTGSGADDGIGFGGMVDLFGDTKADENQDSNDNNNDSVGMTQWPGGESGNGGGGNDKSNNSDKGDSWGAVGNDSGGGWNKDDSNGSKPGGDGWGNDSGGNKDPWNANTSGGGNESGDWRGQSGDAGADTGNAAWNNGDQQPSSNAGGEPAWKNTDGDGTNDAAGDQWNSDPAQNNGAGNNAWETPAAPAVNSTKAPSIRAASHKSTHHRSERMAAPLEIEVRPDETFSADDLKTVARILQQDYQMVWNRVSWRFRDKTGRNVAPEVFEKKITGRVEGEGS